MTFSVVVENVNGLFCASPLGMSGVKCEGRSREEALAALRHELAKRLADGTLVDLEVQPVGVSGLSGLFRDDRMLLGIRDEIYRDRQAERPL